MKLTIAKQKCEQLYSTSVIGKETSNIFGPKSYFVLVLFNHQVSYHRGNFHVIDVSRELIRIFAILYCFLLSVGLQ